MNKKPVQFNRNPVKPPSTGSLGQENAATEARGSSRIKKILEIGEIRSTNFVAGVSGWRLTRRGLEIGNSSGTFPPGTITFTDIQTIADQTILGNGTGGPNQVQQLTLAEMLSIVSGVLGVLTQMSIMHDAAGLKLDGDDAAPGNNKYYGTDGAGNKGFYSIPAQVTSIEDAESESGITPEADGTYTIGAALTPLGDNGQITIVSGIITAVQEAS